MCVGSATPEPVALDSLLTPVDKSSFNSPIRRLRTLFDIYATTCPEPIPAPGLIVTPEIRTQCERYLPIADITATFNRLYSAALSYQPILSSTPFYRSMSWADTFAALPGQFQFSASPARLLEAVLTDSGLLTGFLFASFLPDRFYGGIGRYPGQQDFIKTWLATTEKGTVRCLDTACGTGEDTYGLALLLSEAGFSPEQARIEGWTLEPLEVWTATHRRFPHDSNREGRIRGATAALFQEGFGPRINFRCRDITSSLKNGAMQAGFNLILCNGLLGGPIIQGKYLLDQVVGNLADLLMPGGILLAADNFHGGWKQKCPQAELRASFEAHGLTFVVAGEGIGGLKPH